jgi:peptide/nickel transport system permease protein
VPDLPENAVEGTREFINPAKGPIQPSFSHVEGRWRVLNHPGLVIGALMLLSIFLLAALAGVVSPHDPLDQDLSRRLIPPIWHGDERPSWVHPLGTDQLGRDYLSRLMHGARISLLIGFSTMLISGVVGASLGILAGYFGGRIDLAVNFLVTTRLSLPVVLVSLAVVSLVGSSLTVVIAVLGFLLWDRFAVVLRSATQQVRSQEYVTAARAIGCSNLRILLSEVMPNVMGPLIVVATLEVAHAILLESALSFLGLGVQPPTPSWGLMVAEARGLMFFDPWLIALPGGALFLLVLAINLFGDGLRDLLAPHSRAIAGA